MVVTSPRPVDLEIGAFVRLLEQHHSNLPIGLFVAHTWELPWLDKLRRSGEQSWTFHPQDKVQGPVAMINQGSV